MLLITSGPPRSAARRRRSRPTIRPAEMLPAAAVDPVEGQDLDPVRCGRLDRRAEVGPTASWHPPGHPCARAADDLPCRVQALDREPHAVGWEAAVHIVDVPADHRPRRSGCALDLDPKVPIERRLGIIPRRGAPGGDQGDCDQHESNTDSAHRRLLRTTRNRGRSAHRGSTDTYMATSMMDGDAPAIRGPGYHPGFS